MLLVLFGLVCVFNLVLLVLNIYFGVIDVVGLVGLVGLVGVVNMLFLY